MNKAILCLASLVAATVCGRAAGADEMSLAGEWRLSLDDVALGSEVGPEAVRFEETIRLPGTTAAQRLGPAERFQPRMDGETFQRLRERHPFVGPAWYQREVAVPEAWRGREVRLTLERVLWQSRVWIDGHPIAGRQRSLSTPHRYDLSDRLVPGETHTITLRIDNREQAPIGQIGHGYTPGTQTLWNGVIGGLTLESLPASRLDHVGVRTGSDGRCKLRLEGRFLSGQRVVASVAREGDPSAPAIELGEIRVSADASVVDLAGRCDGITPWSELSPQVYRLEVRLLAADGEELHAHRTTFGFREFMAEGRQLRINGDAVFLRGNLECAIFPLTGHPDAEGDQWRKIMRVTRDYGLNHLRFHSWCPPRVAFEAADRAGVYLQVELPNWTFKMGQDAEADGFLLREGERILREYGNHPSFVMFSLGNELRGDLPSMDRMVERFRSIDPTRLYTSTSFAFSPRGEKPGPSDDFFISQRTSSGWVRGQGFLNSTFPTTDSDYSEGLASVEVPLVTHEVGQYVVYPDLSTLPKYESTPLQATAMEAIRDDLRARGRLADAERFTRDSGKLAALLYKEDIERALRTKGLAGIQLLQLQDFPGQSTATVGLLDAFWDSKGLVTPKRFRRFCSPLVPLARMERFVWTNEETFAADLELANFSQGVALTGFRAELVDDSGRVIASESFGRQSYPIGNGLPIGRFETSLNELEKATKLELVVRAQGADAENAWPVWVYPAEQATPEPVVHHSADAGCLADLAAGRSVLLLPKPRSLRRPIPARFIPVFWSPLHFPNQPGTLGATIDASHPLWRHFPTGTHTDWQWWELMAESTAIDLSGLADRIDTPLRFIDKFNRNAVPAAIFEARVGSGKLLVCTLDVTSDPENRVVARQLLRALKHRVASEDFSPRGELSPAELNRLFWPKQRWTAQASSSHRRHPPSLAIDGDPATLWHSDWSQGRVPLPISLQIDLGVEEAIEGVRLANRAAGSGGRVKACSVETSIDGLAWTRHPGAVRLPNSGDAVEHRFGRRVDARYLRVTAQASYGGRHASLAEIEPLLASTDVRELGLIEGFND